MAGIMRRFFDVILKGRNADPDDSGEKHRGILPQHA
jgi:hypothetical protein